MKITIVVAAGVNNQIGLDGKIPWYVKEDFIHFKNLTMNNYLIMGRVTYESIGRELKNRKIIVISTSKEIVPPGRGDVVSVVTSLNEAVAWASFKGVKEIFICGGARVYRDAINIADQIILSRIDYDGKADTFFPNMKNDNRFILKSSILQSGTPNWSIERWDKIIVQDSDR